MPRSVSSVTTRAASQSTPADPIGATQTLSTPLSGAIQASRVPSGEMCGLMRSGLPNSTLRGMRSTMPNAYHTARGTQAGQPPGSLTGDNPIHVARLHRPQEPAVPMGHGCVSYEVSARPLWALLPRLPPRHRLTRLRLLGQLRRCHNDAHLTTSLPQRRSYVAGPTPGHGPGSITMELNGMPLRSLQEQDTHGTSVPI